MGKELVEIRSMIGIKSPDLAKMNRGTEKKYKADRKISR
jgi:hypothetical protein